MPKTVYDDEGVESRGRALPDGAGTGFSGDSGLRDLTNMLIRKRLKERLSGGGGMPQGRAISAGPGRGGRARYHTPYGAGHTGFGGGGERARTDQALERDTRAQSRAQTQLARKAARGVPKKYVNPGGGGGAYLVDDWDRVPLALRPGATHLSEGSDVTLRNRRKDERERYKEARIMADRQRGRERGWGS